MLKSIGLFVFTPLILIGCANHPADASENSGQALTHAKGAILRAEGAKALSLLSKVDETNLSPEDLAFLNCATERLSDAESAPIPDLSSDLAREILPLFRTYWTKSIMDSEGRHDAERELGRQLSKLLEVDDPDQIEPMMIERLESDGLHVLMGRTGRLRELMIWQTQREEVQRVELPESTVNSTVYYLDDFVSTGWSSYFSCNNLGTGGWAKSDGLYVVVPQWESLDDERFRVSLLAHESQHFHDYSKFPDLVGWELEYRAKLVELALADASQAHLLRRFAVNQSNDEEEAHSFANRMVVSNLRAHLRLEAGEPLESRSTSAIQTAAADLLKQDTQERQKKYATE